MIKTQLKRSRNKSECGHGPKTQKLTASVRAAPFAPLLAKGASVNQRYTLDEAELSNEFHKFMEEWSNRLGITIPQLLTRIVLDSIEGGTYTEKVPDWYPFTKEEEEARKKGHERFKA
jgi:hypothetical protein